MPENDLADNDLDEDDDEPNFNRAEPGPDAQPVGVGQPGIATAHGSGGRGVCLFQPSPDPHSCQNC